MDALPSEVGAIHIIFPVLGGPTVVDGFFGFDSQIVTKILEYLSHGDRRQMALVNTVWNHASLHPAVLKKEVLACRERPESGSSKYHDYLQTLMNSKRRLLMLQFQADSNRVEQTMMLFANLGERIIFLHLDSQKLLTDSLLDSITSCCRNLQTLLISRTEILSITDKTRTQLPKLNYLTLDRVELTDKRFNILMKCFPNLIGIDIRSCRILVWRQAINRFYPNYKNHEREFYDSDDVFTDVNFVRYLSTANSIKSLRLGEDTNILPELPGGLKRRVRIKIG